MSRNLTRTMFVILSCYAANGCYADNCFSNPSGSKLKELKDDLEVCQSDYEQLDKRVKKLENLGMDKKLAQIENSCIALDQRVANLNNKTEEICTKLVKLLNNTGEICDPQQIRLSGVARLMNVTDEDVEFKKLDRMEKIKELRDEGVELISQDGKTLFKNSKFDLDIYVSLNDIQKQAIIGAEKRGHSVEYTDSVLKLNGEVLEEYMKYQYTAHGERMLTESEINELTPRRKELLKKSRGVAVWADGQAKVEMKSGVVLSFSQLSSRFS